jgi:hypothetical protein
MPTPQHSPVSEHPAPPPDDAVRAELDAILRSQTFSRSERLSHFLRFVCESALNGEASKLNEYLIAHQVFGRGENYSPGEDSVVRRQAYSLRQKLQEYFEAEGRNDSVRIELPIGRYVPVFIRVPESAPAVVSTAKDAAGELTAARSPWLTRGATVIAAIALCAGALVGWAASRLQRNTPVIDASIAELWGSWLTDKQGAAICLSNPSIAVVKRMEAPLAPSVLPHPIQAGAEAAQLEAYFNLPPNGYLYLYPGVAHTKMGEAIGGIELAEFFTRAGIPARPTQSRLLNWQFFRTENLILLGHDEANPWLDPILASLPLRLAATTPNAPRRILDLQPRSDERREYAPVYSDLKRQRIEDYALISMLTGLDGRHRLLLVSGIDAEATQIAIEYLIDPINARALESMLRRAAPDHKGDWHFQAILKTELQDNVPLRVSLVAAHVI